MNNNSRIYVPSFNFERKTKAFNKYIGFFVALVSMFSICFFLTVVFAFMLSFFKLVTDSFWQIYLYIFIPVSIFFITSYQLYMFLLSLLSSYKFEDNKIIKGRIIHTSYMSASDSAFETSMTIDMVVNLDNPKRVMADKTAINYNNILTKIELNTNKNYVISHFDTDDYKKKVYENPKLVSETKYSLIYRCNGKKLVIPKIYEGICSAPDTKGSSFITRIINRSLIVFLIAFVILVIDLGVLNANNPKYLENISAAQASITYDLSKYEYTQEKFTTNTYRYTKIVSDKKKSELKYTFDKNGYITNVEISLFYDIYSTNVEKELRYIISTINATFKQEDIDNFINLVKENLEGKTKYGQLSSKDYTLLLSRSEGHIDIHTKKY